MTTINETVIYLTTVVVAEALSQLSAQSLAAVLRASRPHAIYRAFSSFSPMFSFGFISHLVVMLYTQSLKALH